MKVDPPLIIFTDQLISFVGTNSCLAGKDVAENNKAEEVKGKNKNDDSRDANRPRNRNGGANEDALGGDDYEKWEAKNNDSITKIIVEFFPKYFLFFALCVGF